MTSRETGQRGEDEACRWLESNGHTILERNWRASHLETDIITLFDGAIHFVEVKSRTAPAPAEPEDNVGPTKQKRLVRAATAYLNSESRKSLKGDFETVFDIITVEFYPDRTVIDYFPQAWIPMYI